jgi:DNA-binding transcriptional regulator LsrR (DeoR family)
MGMRPTAPAGSAFSEGRAESLLMYRVATKHFQDRQSNLEISRELGISRFRVARLLEQAVNCGVVDIRVAFPAAVDDELSTKVADAFGLQAAEILVDGGDDRWRAHGVAALAVDHVGDLLDDGARLGLTWGRTLDAVTRTASHLQLNLPRADAVQLVGGVPSSTGSLDASDLVRRFSLLTGGRSVVLNAPLVVPTREVGRGLRAERSVAAALAAGESADVALFGVGAWQAGQSQLWDLLNEGDRAAAEEAGATADVCGIMISNSGAEVTTELSERIIGITPAKLRQIPRRVAVVLGNRKVSAVEAALRSGMITDLVVDATVARELLAMAGVIAPTPAVGTAS